MTIEGLGDGLRSPAQRTLKFRPDRRIFAFSRTRDMGGADRGDLNGRNGGRGARL